MGELKIQQIFQHAMEEYTDTYFPNDIQRKVAQSIINCKSGKFGININICIECDHTSIHNNSCRNRNCPNCQALLKETWIDKRKSEVINTPYFHVVFTIPAQLRPLIIANQKLLYNLMHKCTAETLLELSQNPKYLGATPGIIQVLHTWGQELNYHPHVHCIVSGGGLSKDRKLKKSNKHFFIPVKVLATKFRGKFLASLQKLYDKKQLELFGKNRRLGNSFEWNEFRNSLYNKQWCPYIKETFNGFGNAIEYLGRYTHRIAISNNRIISVTENKVTFKVKDYKIKTERIMELENVAFIRRFLNHVLPHGFQKIRYYGFLNNCDKAKNLKIIFKIQGYQQFHSTLTGLTTAEILKQVWNYDINKCPQCGQNSMRKSGQTFHMLN